MKRLRRGGKMDVAILRIVVVALSVICCVCLCGIIVLAGMGKEPPVALASICSICAGALVGILVPSGRPLGDEPPAPGGQPTRPAGEPRLVPVRVASRAEEETMPDQGDGRPKG